MDDATRIEQLEAELRRSRAENAALRGENTALAMERSEALERETATSTILEVIASSPTDVQSVLDAVVESTVRLAQRAVPL